VDEWLARWLIDNGFVREECACNFDAFKFIEDSPAKGDIFNGLCVCGLCLNLGESDGDLLAEIGHDYARRHLIVPIRRENGDLYVATCSPFDFAAVDDIRVRLGLNVVCLLARRDLILSFLGVTPVEKSATVEPAVAAKTDECKIPLDRLFEHFTGLAVAMRASDVHFEHGNLGMRIRFRVDGKLRVIQMLDANLARAAMVNIKLRAKLKLDESRLPQDGRMKLSIADRDYDVRVSIVPNIYGENAVLRIFNADSSEFSMDNLGLSDSQIAHLKLLAQLDSGLLLVSGPTGSGKTTTVYSLLKYISSPAKKVITIEDPIEYLLPNVNQVSVDEKIGLTFDRILRAVLRQAPNVIFIGEIRDTETAKSAIQAALTGHLVLSTVHSGSSEEAILRLRDLGISKYLIDSCVRGVISQQLLRLKCKFCGNDGKCDRCFGRGYYGRTGVFEMLASGDLAIGKSPCRFDNFGFLCTFQSEISRLGDILYGEDFKIGLLSAAIPSQRIFVPKSGKWCGKRADATPES
jgi:type IV pilus assembly protein PilB